MLTPVHGGLECQAKELGLHSVGSRPSLEAFEAGRVAVLMMRNNRIITMWVYPTAKCPWNMQPLVCSLHSREGWVSWWFPKDINSKSSLEGIV